MPSPVEPSFIQPAAIATLIRKNEVVAESQIAAALAAMGCSAVGLRDRVRAAVQSLIERPGAEFQSTEVFANPSAADRWKLIWSSACGPHGAYIDDVFHSMYLNWRKACRACKTRIVSSKQLNVEQRLYPRGLQHSTAHILRTGIFIDLLKRDPAAARTWQVVDTSSKPYFNDAVAASYRRSDGTTILIVIPVFFGMWFEDDEDRADILRRMLRLHRKTKSIVEMYSLDLPGLPWPGRDSRFDEIRRRRDSLSHRRERKLTRKELKEMRKELDSDYPPF